MNIDEVNSKLASAIADSKLATGVFGGIDLNMNRFNINQKVKPFIVVDSQVYINQAILESATIKI